MAQEKKIHNSSLRKEKDSPLLEKSIGSEFPAAKSINENDSGVKIVVLERRTIFILWILG